MEELFMSNEVLYEVEEGVATITINRPDKLNALNKTVVDMMRSFFQKAEEDPEVRAVILTGVGEKAFAAGADITAFPKLDSKSVRPYVENGQAACSYIESMSIPVIAAVNGYALGGGCEFAMACDIRYASSNARFGQPEINLGVIPGYGGTVRPPRLVGLGVAKELVLSGKPIKAEEALRIGLVNKVFDSIEDLRNGSMELATILAKKPGVAVKLAKQSLNKAWEMNLKDNLSYEVDSFCQTFDTEDKKEGVDAFLNKRDAVFKHK
jgi:enoyl-CoA hydratase